MIDWLEAGSEAFGGGVEEPPFASILAEYLLDLAGAALRRACEGRRRPLPRVVRVRRRRRR